ncbi:MAG: NADH-quinone oxidoreductase subunit NuoG [Pseudomonadota bacterium]
MKLIVDGQEIEVPASHTLLQACEQAGAEIPRFCYHERLSIAGNCRMCLVEVIGEPKPVASCARSVRDLRPGKDGAPPVINTGTSMVKKAREGVMEFLLVNHPLDCPICDQGGECDLQDQAMSYGVDTSRYDENKRAVEDKYIGPLVKTSMNRCIHCTRCVRFTQEVAGVADLGATGRGEEMEITSYLETAMDSELQGNIIDLCPVGALTSKPYAFKARPWELTKTDGIDVMDALGSAIRIDSRGREVMRILPRINENVNEEWISDKTRFVWDGLKTQRLDKPYIRENGRLRAATWLEAFQDISRRMKRAAAARIGAIAGDLASVEDMFALKLLMMQLGSKNFDARQDGSRLHPKFGRGSYIFNNGITALENADTIVLVGTNPRLEAPVLNARIRKRWLRGGLKIFVVGERVDLTYDYTYLGAGPDSFTGPLDISLTDKSLVIAGQGAFSRTDGEAVLAAFSKLGSLNILHTAASRVGAFDIGFVAEGDALDAVQMAQADALDIVFNLGADEIDIQPGAFVVYIGTHGDKGAQRADVILPGAAYTEKSGIYVNTEGRVQYASRAVFPPGEAHEDWAIIRALSEQLAAPLPFENLSQLRALIFEQAPHLADRNTVAKGEVDIAALGKISGKTEKTPFTSVVKDFYLTNPIARASRVMAECSKLRAATAQMQAAE